MKLSPAAQAVYSKHTAGLGMSAEEQNEVGRLVAIAREQARTPAWLRKFRDAANPTKDESAELADAEAKLAAAHQATEIARVVAIQADVYVQELRNAGYESYLDNRREPEKAQEMARARQALANAAQDYDLALTKERIADKAAMRLRGAVARQGHARQIVHASRGL